MKRKRESFFTVLVDGGVRLPPGCWVVYHVDTPFAPNDDQLRAWIIRVRGGMLSEVFGIENDLVQIQLAEEFATVDQSKTPATFFDRDQELRERHSLEKKIEDLKPIARKLFEKAEANSLVQDLASCKEVRNLMAHNPCWIEPVNDEERQRTVGMKLFIGNRNHIWELEEADVTSWLALFGRVRRQLIRLRCRLTGEPEPDFVSQDSFLTKAAPG